MNRIVVVVTVLLAAASCQSEKAASADRPALGKERGDCKPGKLCDPGLMCLSNLCVRPPPADCAQIAEQMASMDLGNYAEPEARAPVVSKYRAACEKAYVSKEQGECIDKAKDKFAIAQCAPDMFPELKSPAGTGDCAQIATKVRAQMSKQMSGTDPQTQQMLQKVLTVMQQSCDQDGWPDAFKKCILLAGDTADGMNTCSKQMPAEIQNKMQQRMVQAMQPPPSP